MDLKKISLILQSEGKKVLIYHTDLDGVCSAVLMLKFFKGFGLAPRDGPFIDDRFLKELEKEKPDLMVVLDIPIDQEWEKVEYLQNKLPDLKMVVLDHHIPEKNLNSDRNIHMNPRFKENVYIPASCMVYRLLENLGLDVKPFIWIAAMGVIGDYGIEDCTDLFDECRKAYPSAIGDNPMKSSLRDISEYVMAALIMHGERGVEKSVEMLLGTDDFESVARNEYFRACREKVDAEMRRIMKDFEKKKRESVELGMLLYKLDSRLNLASTVSSIIAEKNPDKIVIITKHSGQYVKVSARYQKGGINLNDLMKSASEGIGSGGGHEKAAGALINRNDAEEFETRLIRKVAELKKNDS